MGQFGKVAVEAVARLNAGRESNPPGAWRSAARDLLSHSASSAAKVCPKGAFLGLCEAGLVAGVPKGAWTDSADNKAYAIRAVQALRTDPGWLEKPKSELWRLVSRSDTKAPNNQIDVVFELWRNGLITQEPVPEGF